MQFQNGSTLDFTFWTAAPIIIGIFLSFNLALIILVISYDMVIRPSYLFITPLLVGTAAKVELEPVAQRILAEPKLQNVA